MKYFGDGLSEAHKVLQKIIRRKDHLEEARTLFLDIHGLLHQSEVSGSQVNTVDGLFSDLTPQEACMMPTSKDETIAWVIWHIARIEDLTMNVLAGGRNEIFNQSWKERIHAPITDTGNALSDDEILSMSREMNLDALLAYRREAGRQTRQLLAGLTWEDMTRQVSPRDLERVRQLGGVTDQEESAWLLEFWGKKDVSGLLLMPPTRHVMLHMNDCMKWKEHIRSGKKCFRTG